MKPFFTSLFEIRFQAAALLLALIALSVTDVQGQGTVIDNDKEGVTVHPTSLTVLEGAPEVYYTVLLDSKPRDSVTVTPERKIGSSMDVRVRPLSLKFTPKDWNQKQKVYVSAAEDLDATDDDATIRHTVESDGEDYGFGNVTAADVSVTVDDDEIPSTEVTLSVRPMEVSEETAKLIYVTAKLNGGTRDSATEVALTVGSGTATAGHGLHGVDQLQHCDPGGREKRDGVVHIGADKRYEGRAGRGQCR